MSHKIPVCISVHVTGPLFLSGQFEGTAGRPKTMSLGEYGLNRGVDRVLDLVRDNNISCTFFVPGEICEKYPDRIKRIATENHEIANHGLHYENFANFTYEEQLELLRRSNEIIRQTTGVTPVGFRAPNYGDLTLDTLRALDELGFVYDSSLYDEDDMYKIDIEGKPTSLCEVPVKWPLYDLPYFFLCFNPAFPTGQGRVAHFTRVLENWQLEYEAAERFNIPYVLQVDTQTIGKPGRINLLEELLDFIQKRGTAQFMTMRELASTCK